MKQFLASVLAFFISLFGCILTPAPAADLQPIAGRNAVASQEQLALFESIFDSETAYLASLQLANGAIPMTGDKNGEVTVNPYFADFAALALLDKGDVYADEVRSYMEWHLSRLNTAETDPNGLDGTICDYTVTLQDGQIVSEVSKGSYDSVDSYAATFLTVLDKYNTVTGDTAFLLAHAEEIDRIARAMLSTAVLGLTVAKPDYEIKFLMDNCEVCEGTAAAVRLYKNVLCKEDSSLSITQKRCEALFSQLTKAMENVLWNKSEGHYRVAVSKFGTEAIAFSWDSFYPCATAQLFPILHGVIEADTQRANDLYNKFCESYSWESFDIPSEFCWGSNALAAAKMNDLDRVVLYFNEYLEYSAARSYPLYNADIARVSMAAFTMLQNNIKR